MPSGSQNGRSNNPKGKPKGTVSAKTLQWKALGAAITDRHAKRFNSLLDTLEDEEFIKAYTNIINYFQPKLSSTRVEAEHNFVGSSPIKFADTSEKDGD